MTPQIMDEACVQCGEGITNPICIRCVGEEMETWMREKRPASIPMVRLTTKSFEAYMHDATLCIICGGNMNVCAHCYTREVLSSLADKKLAKEMQEQFNYEMYGIESDA